MSLPPPRVLARPLRKTYRRVAGKAFGFPFESRTERRLLVHVTHHKVGTVWFKNVLGRVAARHGLRFEVLRGKQAPAQGMVLTGASDFAERMLAPFRGTHIIRDPRDVVVSGYFYHLRCTEEWALKPRESLGGKSFQEHLRTLKQGDGLIAEMKMGFAPHSIRQMTNWDYGRREILELRYEDMIADEPGQWLRVFRHYGFREHAARQAAHMASRYSISSEAYRARRSRHVRSGKAGDWRCYFGEREREVFLEEFGDALVKLGYERDNRSW